MESNIPNLSFQKEQLKPQGLKWRSFYNPIALEMWEKVGFRKIKRSHPKFTKDVVNAEVQTKKEKLGRYLDAIDQEFIENFGVFTSSADPEIRFPYTRISIKNIVNRIEGVEKLESQKQEPLGKRKVYVVFTPFSQPPNGDPSDPINTIYDRVMVDLPEIRKREDVIIYALGLPTSKWGSVSQRWVDDLEKGVGGQEEHGFSQHGRLYAEFLRPILTKYLEDTKTKTSFIFRGDSMGTILADKTAGEMPEIWESLRLLLDVPTGVHAPPRWTIKLPLIGNIPLSLKGAQVLLFGTELFARGIADELVRKTLFGKKRGFAELTDALSRKGVISFESSEQNKLKRSAFTKEIKLLVKGTPRDTDNYRSLVVQGMLDPATTNIERLNLLRNRDENKGFFKAGDRSLGIGIAYTHWVDRGRWLDKWVRGIRLYERHKN